MNDKKERFSNWCRQLCGREEIPYDEDDDENEIFYMKTCDPYILSYYYN